MDREDSGSESEPSVDNLSERELAKLLPQEVRKKVSSKKDDSRFSTMNAFLKGKKGDKLAKNVLDKEQTEKITLKIEKPNVEKLISPMRSRSIRE